MIVRTAELQQHTLLVRRIRLAWPRGTNFCSAEIINLNALLRRMFHNMGRNIYPEKWLQIELREREVTRIVEYLKFLTITGHSSFYQPARSKVVAVNIWLSQICEKIAYQLSILNENILFVFEVSQPQTCQVTTTFIVLRLKPCASSVEKKTPCSCFIPDTQDALFSFSLTMLFIGTGTHHENHEGSNGNLT